MIESSGAMCALLADVHRFHVACGSTSDATEPLAQPNPERIKLRARLITEEFIETMAGMLDAKAPKERIKEVVRIFNKEIDDGPVDFDLEATADGLADLIYVCVGAALAFGIPLDRVWSEVQRANMAKTGGGRDAGGKIQKPDGWQEPRIHEAVFGEAA